MRSVPDDMRVGTTHNTNSFGTVEIVDYVKSTEVLVRFVGYSHIVTAQAGSIRRGQVKNVMMPNVQGVGYFGVGGYTRYTHKEANKVWCGMLERCYSEKFRRVHPTYEKCTVDKRWHNFQTFAKWFDEYSNYCKELFLDKDIIVQGNKVYSPDNCTFVSRKVNNLVTARGANRGAYKLGVSWHRQHRKFYACCNDGDGKHVFLGLHDTEDKAHESYKEYKYKIFKSLAEKQNDIRIKQGLLNWVIPEY